VERPKGGGVGAVAGVTFDVLCPFNNSLGLEGSSSWHEVIKCARASGLSFRAAFSFPHVLF
jgi:hypothetical protein